jgi:single-strand DNA-binding protein
MNKTILIGRLVKDPEVKTTQSQVPFCSFTIAVDRKFKNANGERQADFLACVAWRQQASFLGQYFQKGSRVAVIGNLQSRSYDDANGKKVYVTEVVCDEIEFVDGKKEEQEPEQNQQAAPAVDGGFYPSMDDDTTLPFDL